MTWLPEQAQGETPLDRVFGLRPNLYAAWRDFAALFWERRVLPPRVLELCRLLVARLHGCESELRLRYRPALDAGLREAQVAALGSGDESEFDAAERACLRFAEMFVRDPHAISDADAAFLAGATFAAVAFLSPDLVTAAGAAFFAALFAGAAFVPVACFPAAGAMRMPSFINARRDG